MLLGRRKPVPLARVRLFQTRLKLFFLKAACASGSALAGSEPVFRRSESAGSEQGGISRFRTGAKLNVPDRDAPACCMHEEFA